MRINTRYFLCTVVLFITDVMIAAFIHDAFIRPTFGDFLVVILMYCGIRTFIKFNYRIIVLFVLCVAYAIEVSQYFHLIIRLGLQHSTLAQLILGSGFAWGDMLAYTLAAGLIWVIESRKKMKFNYNSRDLM